MEAMIKGRMIVPDEMDETLVTLTADIVSAHVANNSVAVGDLARLIANVHGALAGLGTGAQQEPESASREPAVSVRSSVKPDAITCLICGARQKTLKRHLSTSHDLTPAQYRSEFALKPDYPMVAPNYSEQRRTLAKAIGLGTKGRGRGRSGKARKPRGGAAPTAG